MINKAVNYVKSSIEEMKKVAWPTRKQTYQYTMLVIGISVGTAVFLGALDFIFNWALERTISLG
jgi:preprotein translocase subunit SecE